MFILSGFNHVYSISSGIASVILLLEVWNLSYVREGATKRRKFIKAFKGECRLHIVGLRLWYCWR